MVQGPLQGVRVLDLTQGVPGPYATKLFSDYGADVIKVEPPGLGDESRRIGPFPDDRPDPERSGMFLALNTGKRSVTLDLGCASGRGIARRLFGWAELVIENYGPGGLEALGLGPEVVAEANPAAALVRVSNFGQSGPQRDFRADDLLLYAAGGVLQVTGDPTREPVAIGLHAPYFLAGGVIAAMAMGAWRLGRRDGAPEVVDVSMQEILAGSMDRGGPNIIAHQYSGSLLMERTEPLKLNALPNGVFPCSDGYIQVSTHTAWFARMCKAMGRPELLDDQRLLDNLNDYAAIGEEMEAIMYEWSLSRTKQEAMEQGQAAGWPVSALNTVEDAFRDPHLRERAFYTTLEHPAAGALEYPGIAVHFLDTPGAMRRAPLLGEHNAEVLGELGYSHEELVVLRQEGVI